VCSAVRAAKKSGDPYHFVLLDYRMPGMDGVEVAQAIKADPEIRDTVIVLLTSVGNWSEVRRMGGASIDASLVKPVRQSQLLKTLAQEWSKKLEGVPAARPQPERWAAKAKSELAPDPGCRRQCRQSEGCISYPHRPGTPDRCGR
jgi:CheY-like chemotaxis protein